MCSLSLLAPLLCVCSHYYGQKLGQEKGRGSSRAGRDLVLEGQDQPGLK